MRHVDAGRALEEAQVKALTKEFFATRVESGEYISTITLFRECCARLGGSPRGLDEVVWHQAVQWKLGNASLPDYVLFFTEEARASRKRPLLFQ